MYKIIDCKIENVEIELHNAEKKGYKIVRVTPDFTRQKAFIYLKKTLLQRLKDKIRQLIAHLI